jgi:hypothetical protein
MGISVIIEISKKAPWGFDRKHLWRQTALSAAADFRSKIQL